MARRRKALGNVDLLGLNSFGLNPGINSLWGVAIGGGVAGVTTIALRHTGNVHSEAFGLLAGLASAGAMYSMKATRHAAVGAALGSVIASGLALIERKLLGTATVPAAVVPAAAQAVAGMGVANIRALNGLGIPMARNLNGLGMPTITDQHAPVGAIPGVAGNQLSGIGNSVPPVSLLGTMTPQAAHLLGMGGPSVHGLSASYGATLLGGGR